jgi:hypothetical protein
LEIKRSLHNRHSEAYTLSALGDLLLYRATSRRREIFEENSQGRFEASSDEPQDLCV